MSSLPARTRFRLEVQPHLEAVVVRARGVLDGDAAGQLDECLCALWRSGCDSFISISLA